jgi:hypothetical protein
LVHGLGGHPQKTWSSDERSPKASAEPRRSMPAKLGDKVNKRVGRLIEKTKSLVKPRSRSSTPQRGESANRVEIGADNPVASQASTPATEGGETVNREDVTGNSTPQVSTPVTQEGEPGTRGRNAAPITPQAPTSAATSEAPKSKIFWPRDLFAPNFKDVRVLTFGYESNPAHSTQNNLYTLSKGLLSRLESERVNCVSYLCYSTTFRAPLF